VSAGTWSKAGFFSSLIAFLRAPTDSVWAILTGKTFPESWPRTKQLSSSAIARKIGLSKGPDLGPLAWQCCRAAIIRRCKKKGLEVESVALTFSREGSRCVLDPLPSHLLWIHHSRLPRHASSALPPPVPAFVSLPLRGVYVRNHRLNKI
jgi:hypothetical protein